jgi:hypothetical protein
MMNRCFRKRKRAQSCRKSWAPSESASPSRKTKGRSMSTNPSVKETRNV